MAGWTGGIWRNTLRLGYITRMPDSTPSFRVKVETIFRELGGDRAVTLDAQRLPASITSTITAALAGESGDADAILRADKIASISQTGTLRRRL